MCMRAVCVMSCACVCVCVFVLISAAGCISAASELLGSCKHSGDCSVSQRKVNEMKPAPFSTPFSLLYICSNTYNTCPPPPDCKMYFHKVIVLSFLGFNFLFSPVIPESHPLNVNTFYLEDMYNTGVEH